MKFNLLKTFLLLCFVFAISVDAQEMLQNPFYEKLPAAQRLGLKGKVRTLEIVSGTGGLKEFYVFNASGNLTEYSEVYRGDNRIFLKRIYFYNESGQKTRVESFREGKPAGVATFKYDAKNNLIEGSDFNSKNEPIGKFVNKYNEKGQLTETVKTLLKPVVFEFLMGFGVPAGDYKDFYTYDENGNPASVKSFFPEIDTPFDNRAFRYNAQNQKVEETVISQTYENKPPRIARYFYVYNRSGDVAEGRYYESVKDSNVEEVKDRFKIIDDKGTVQNGQLISDKPYMILWSVAVSDYEYDAAGNWTKRTGKWKMREMAELVPVTQGTVERIITYF